jgi:hypothetical protein
LLRLELFSSMILGLLFFFFCKPGNAHNFLVLVYIDEAYALGVPANNGKLGNGNSDDFPRAGNHHQIIFVGYLFNANDSTIAFRGLDGDNSLATASLYFVF